MERSKIEEEVAKTLAELGSLRRASAGPYFYTRLKTRLDEEYTSGRIASGALSLRSLAAAAAFALLIVANVYSFSRTAALGAEQQKRQQITQFAEHYNLRTSRY